MPQYREQRPRRVRLVGSAALVVSAIGLAGCIAPAPSAPPATLPPAQPNGVAGVLFQDANGDGEWGTGERALSGWTVRLYGTGPLALLTTVTANDGGFDFPDVPHLAEGAEAVTLRFTPVLEGPAAEHLPLDTALSQSVEQELGSSRVVAVSSFRLCLEENNCPGLEYPDLWPMLTSVGGEDYPPPTATSIDSTTEPGRTLLRFATSSANTGGLLHVVGGAVTADLRQNIRQIVYGPGVVFDRAAGDFVYHPEHHHVHVGDFMSYELVDERDTVVATSSKVSFCLTDIQPVDQVADWSLTEISLDLPPLECGPREQGINPGHADYYGPKLPDQWIDVTDIPAGDYRVRITVNPERFLLESDYDNNVVEFSVTLPG